MKGLIALFGYLAGAACACGGFKPNGTRPIVADRCFTSPVFENALSSLASKISDDKLRQIFVNAAPNTLDTTVFVNATKDSEGREETVVVTGDIDAMWLRDSTNQMLPYLSYVNDDAGLKDVFVQVIRKQVSLVLLDGYANAFDKDPLGGGASDKVFPVSPPGVHESKYEIDSLAAVIKFARNYYEFTNDNTPFTEVNSSFLPAMKRIVQIVKEQQNGTDEQFGHEFYTFERQTTSQTETLMLGGRGSPAKKTGMTRSFFRPSDDACTFSFLIPANAMMSVELKHLSKMVKKMGLDEDFAAEVKALSKEIKNAIYEFAVVKHPVFGDIFAYEVDGYGSHILMDDANVPSLLSLPYLGFIDQEDPLYLRTRKFVLSTQNPYFFQGPVFKGIGGPHVGWNMIWPMSLIVQGLTSNDEDEIRWCIKSLRDSDGGKLFIHESFNKVAPIVFTRSWFAWANSLFGEFIFNVGSSSKYQHILFEPINKEEITLQF